MKAALVIIDIQNDFVPGGSLAVDQGHLIIPVINALQPCFDLVVATQDWHPQDHVSFASNHINKKPGDVVCIDGNLQTLWPDHCVQDSKGGALADMLETGYIQDFFLKGTDSQIDSYSGFFNNNHTSATGLGAYLQKKRVEDVYIAGLALDYCVKFSALDAVSLDFNTYVIKDACRGVELEQGDIDRAIREMQDAGVRIIQSEEITG